MLTKAVELFLWNSIESYIQDVKTEKDVKECFIQVVFTIYWKTFKGVSYKKQTGTFLAITLYRTRVMQGMQIFQLFWLFFVIKLRS